MRDGPAQRSLVGAGIALVGVLAALLGVLAVRALSPDTGTVYTVARVRAGLARDPARWDGRLVAVRGVLVSYRSPVCHIFDAAWCPAGLQDPGTPLAGPALRFRPGPPDPLMATIRGWPLVGPLAPPPQRPGWAGVAVYRVRLRIERACDARPRPCFDAVVPDAAPPHLGPERFYFPIGPPTPWTADWSS